MPTPPKPLKCLNWYKIPNHKVNGTIWANLQGKNIYEDLDLGKVDRLFPALQTKEPTKNHTSKISVINAKKALSVNILLSNLKMPSNNVARIIKTMDAKEELNEDMV